MPQFHYAGRDVQGQLIEGAYEANNESNVLAFLRSKQITPIKIVLLKEEKKQELKLFNRQTTQISIDELSMFCRQMQALMRSGIPIIQAMSGLAENAKTPYFKQVLGSVIQSLAAGSTLASSLGMYPHIFSQMFISMVHMGETTGHLDRAFNKLIGHLELERETKRRVTQALRYPISVLVAITIAMIIVNVFVIPSFAGVFAKLGAELPLPTRILIAMSNFTVNYWWLVVLVITSVVVSIKKYLATEQGVFNWDKKKLNLPIFGKIFTKIILARFTRSFAMLSEAGISILQGLRITARVVDNLYVSSVIEKMVQGIERGDSLTNTAAASGLFSGLVLQMISVGEETGSVDALFNEVADFYEEEVDYDLKRLSDAIEPIILVFMGGLVLVLALGIFLPMWNLGGIMK